MEAVRRTSILSFTCLFITGFLFGTDASAKSPDPVTVPWMEEIIEWAPGGTSSDVMPGRLFWEHTFRADEGWQGNSRVTCRGIEARGEYPVLEMLRWGSMLNNTEPGVRQWAEWMNAHQHYWWRDKNGVLNGNSQNVEFVNPHILIDRQDWPEGIDNARIYQWAGDRLFRLCRASGARGYFAADYYDMMPHTDTRNHDFNIRAIDDFENYAGVDVPGSSIAERAQHILQNYQPQWNDYMCDYYAARHAEVPRRLRMELDVKGFVSFQGDYGVQQCRYRGMDLQFYKKWGIQFGEILKYVEVQGDGLREIPIKSNTPTFVAIWAARAPEVCVGLKADAESEDFRDGLRKVFRNSGLEDEYAYKYLKTEYLSVGWMGVIHTDGTLRRAITSIRRHYWDAGRVPEKVSTVLRNHYPARPFGPAFYYSLNVERDYEKTGGRYDFTGNLARVQGKAGNAVYNGVPAGYMISTTTLQMIRAPYYPTTWVTSDLSRMPQEELAWLRAIAPVFDIDDGYDIPSPVSFSQGLSGYAFVDQEDKTIVLVWRRGRNSTTGDESVIDTDNITAQISFEGVQDGTYRATDCFDDNTFYDMSITDGKGAFSFPMERWDCRAFWTTVPTPNGGIETDVHKSGLINTEQGRSAAFGIRTGLHMFSTALPIVRAFDVSGRLRYQQPAENIEQNPHINTGNSVYIIETKPATVSGRASDRERR
jgi:hypothetical protein